MSSILVISDYVINVPKLNKILEENIKSYDFITELLNKYLSLTKEFTKIDKNDYMTLQQIFNYKILLENTLLQEGILVKKRVSKIEKILNSK